MRKAEYIDKNGTIRVSADGEYIVQFTPFLDEDGKPAVLEETSQRIK
jgi:hypothetical protein